MKVDGAVMESFHNVKGLAPGACGNQQSTAFAIGRNQSDRRLGGFFPVGNAGHDGPLFHPGSLIRNELRCAGCSIRYSTNISPQMNADKRRSKGSRELTRITRTTEMLLFFIDSRISRAFVANLSFPSHKAVHNCTCTKGHVLFGTAFQAAECQNQRNNP